MPRLKKCLNNLNNYIEVYIVEIYVTNKLIVKLLQCFAFFLRAINFIKDFRIFMSRIEIYKNLEKFDPSIFSEKNFFASYFEIITLAQ